VKLDIYVLQARLFLAFLVVIPISLTIVAWSLEKFIGWSF